MSLFSRLVVTALPLVPKALVGRVARPYVAGESLDDAVRVVESLNERGAMATLDVLGEEVEERDKALAAVEEYVRVFDAIEEHGLDANVSIKLTLLGLKIDQSFCLDNVATIADCARRYGNFVRIDMEDRSCTDPTLEIYHRLQPEFGNLGVVFQSYMRRTLADIDGLPERDANVRLCKGIYIEPRHTAWKGFDTVRLNFVQALEKMLRSGIYVGIATHDEYLVCAAVALLDRYEVSRDDYEFQMLLGVDEELRDILIDGGHRLRVYVPYGEDWYQYSVRRLRENPEVAGHVARAFFGMRKAR
ncbi:MAG: proline dehydrogenase family protein [Thermoanaerobaculia bacterium]|nr:proline dehydrogenase family protein [Thermoanaerobaculia bacterium]